MYRCIANVEIDIDGLGDFYMMTNGANKYYLNNIGLVTG